MERLLLTSYFKKVANLIPNFLETDPAGKKVCFITTASVPEKVDFFVSDGKKSVGKAWNGNYRIRNFDCF